MGGLRIGIGIGIGGAQQEPSTPPSDPSVLLEDGTSYLLLEDGSKLLLE